ncbi:MAG: S-layer homology domain-containing protein, partial [Oscillospiraceae bacterium]|nr:S-layer homology domain-containing protein [Oscillospiraceae bacterium]
MRKVLSAFLILCLLLPMAFVPMAWATENPFDDVPSGAYYYDAVMWAVENKITAGTSATAFSPGASCTRAQMVTFLWRASGSPEPEASECPFVDVPNGAYYTMAVVWAAENNITAGTSATEFSPGATVTRGQTVTFLYRYAKGTAPQIDCPFEDVSDTSYWYLPVLWAYQNGVTAGVSATKFAPMQPCTRAQIVTFLWRLSTVE